MEIVEWGQVVLLVLFAIFVGLIAIAAYVILWTICLGLTPVEAVFDGAQPELRWWIVAGGVIVHFLVLIVWADSHSIRIKK